MALGPPVSTTNFVVVYNPSQYIYSVTHGQNSERTEALKHLLECLTHSDIDLITSGSIWLCITGLLTNEEQKSFINSEIRSIAMKCILELIKIEQLERRFFNTWLSFDFLARYKIDNETDGSLWLECFSILTDSDNNIHLIDDRLRVRLLIQVIGGVLKGLLKSANAFQTLKDIITIHWQLRSDELSLLFEYIFRQLNVDDDEATNLHRNLSQAAAKKSIEFLALIIDHHVLNTTLVHYFIQNIVDLHDKYTFSTGINAELLQLISNHLIKAQWHTMSVISVLCGIIVERLEAPLNNDIDPLSTLLFVLTQTLVDVHQYRLKDQHQVQLSNEDIIHRKCFLNRLQQLPICWLTILHQVFVKRQNVNIVLLHFKEFLKTINDKTIGCALNIFGITVWKMMNEILKMCYDYFTDGQKGTISPRNLYDECLTIVEELASRLCCLPDTMITFLFDVKRLTSITRTPLREEMLKQSSRKLLFSIRPHNPDWLRALKDLIDCIILNPKESVSRRVDVLTTVFDKYLWFKGTDQAPNFIQTILSTLEKLICIDLTSISENEFLSKHALLKQAAIRSIFEHFLLDNSIDPSAASCCYEILDKIYNRDCIYITSIDSIHRPLMETLIDHMCTVFENNLIYTRFKSFNHCSLILKFFIQNCFANYSKTVSCMQVKTRLLIWQLLLNMNIRPSDKRIGMYSTKKDAIDYGTFRTNMDVQLHENEQLLDLNGYLCNMVDWLRCESLEVKNLILEYLCNFLKEQSIVSLSQINIDQLVLLLIDTFHYDLVNKNSSVALKCLTICTCYKTRITKVTSLIDCFMEAMCSLKSSLIIMAIQAFTVCLSNLHEEMKSYIPRIILYMTSKFDNDSAISKNILEFLMHILFGNNNDSDSAFHIVKILIDIMTAYPYQTAHNLILSHTLLCFHFNQLSMNQRQSFAYYILRSLYESVLSNTQDSILIERPARLQRSGSLSSLNDDMHNNDVVKRKMTILDAASSSTPTNSNEDNSSLKKLNDELVRITVNYVNDHLYEFIIPNTALILLPRDVRRHHINSSWLADEKLLYEIKSYEFQSFSHSKDLLINSTREYDDAMKNRYRRYTDGYKQNMRKKKDLKHMTTWQDDLHIRPLELDTNRSLFNDGNLWIAVTVRSLTSTKIFLAVDLLASPGLVHSKKEKLHWFEAVKLSDTASDKQKVIKSVPNYCQQEQNINSINKIALNDELQSIFTNIDRKDEEFMLNRHNEAYFPQRVVRVPSEARKSIDTIDNVEPVRIAKVGVVYIHPRQDITEVNFLSNIQTSERYKQFMLSLAKLKSIYDLQKENFYCPLLDANNSENCGQYAYVWQNPIYQVLFHASTMMPNTRADHEFKKKLIGNDFVLIVYNESDYSFEMKTLKSGVCQYAIEVCPQTDSNLSRVRLKRRIHNTVTAQNSSKVDTMPLSNIDYVLSDDHVASYVRILALCLCQQGELEARHRSSSPVPFAISPWQNRLQALRALHTRCSLSYNNRQ